MTSAKIENIFVLPVIVMIVKYLLLLPMSVFLVACTSVPSMETALHTENDVATVEFDDENHEMLARKYEGMAHEFRAKAQEKKDLLENSHYSNKFGKNRDSIKSRAALKIQQYEQAAKEYSQKAIYHKALAEEHAAYSSAKSRSGNPDNSKLDKTKVFMDEISSTDNKGKF